MDYGDILSRGWSITWNNKYLWVLGFLAALASVSTGNSSSNSFSDNAGTMSPEELTAMGTIFVAVLCVGLIIGLAVWLLSLAARGGLISAAARIDGGGTMTLGEAFAAGTAKIWSLIGLSLVMYGPFLLVALGLGVTGFLMAGTAITEAVNGGDPEVLLASFGTVMACLAGLMCLLAPVMLVVSFVYPFAFRGIMLAEMTVFDAISHGWKILRDNVAEILLLGVIFFFINFGFGLATAVVMLPLALLVFAPMVILTLEGGAVGTVGIIWLVGASICMGILGALLRSVLTTWQSASFTVAYQQFAADVKAQSVF